MELAVGAPVGVGVGAMAWAGPAGGTGLLTAADILVAIGGGGGKRRCCLRGCRLVTQDGRHAHGHAGERPALALGPGGTGGIGGQQAGQEAAAVGRPLKRPSHAEHRARMGDVVEA